MKQLFIKSQENEINTFVDLFNFILENKNYNLDQMVKGNSLAVEDGISEEFLEKLKEFLSSAPDIIRISKDKEEIWSSFEKLDDYENNKKFINWLKKYVETIIRPIEDARFINELDLESFDAMSQYCFENLILKDIGKNSIDDQWNKEEIIIMRKILFTFIDMLDTSFYSEEHALEKMERIFGIKKQYCVKWLPFIKEHEDRLWKIMLMKKYNRIENKLDELLDKMDAKIPEGIL